MPWSSAEQLADGIHAVVVLAVAGRPNTGIGLCDAEAPTIDTRGEDGDGKNGGTAARNPRPSRMWTL